MRHCFFSNSYQSNKVLLVPNMFWNYIYWWSNANLNCTEFTFSNLPKINILLKFMSKDISFRLFMKSQTYQVRYDTFILKFLSHINELFPFQDSLLVLTSNWTHLLKLWRTLSPPLSSRETQSCGIMLSSLCSEKCTNFIMFWKIVLHLSHLVEDIVNSTSSSHSKLLCLVSTIFVSYLCICFYGKKAT